MPEILTWAQRWKQQSGQASNYLKRLSKQILLSRQSNKNRSCKTIQLNDELILLAYVVNSNITEVAIIFLYWRLFAVRCRGSGIWLDFAEARSESRHRLTRASEVYNSALTVCACHGQVLAA
ncbi:hypothetical protein [Rhizobium leguminosarum]|uniref:hypothetical protein n=1 Tax=Rhizobium leguminosarum TaxID=384 RepID=UPI0024B346CB|nr:hypothetical protein [Rhizobium leguminosarum]WHO78218.1 hypothetical protein QMO81_000869 [Rhizobium leguminosarum]